MSETSREAPGVSVRTSLAAVLVATALATVIWVLATIAGAELIVSYPPAPPITITVVNVVVAALVGSLAGWGLLALLRRLTGKARIVWTTTAAVAAGLSLGGPLSATASSGTKASLVAMHLAVATVLIVVLRKSR